MTDRAYYLAVCVWGERFTDILLNTMLASYVAPGNQAARPHLLLYTTEANLYRITHHPLWAQVKDYSLMRIDHPDPGVNKFRPVSDAYRHACQLAIEQKAMLGFLMPDMLLSDGLLLRARESIESGHSALRVCALRHDMEGLLKELVLSKTWDAGQPCAIPARTLASAAARHLHSETISYEVDAPYFGVPMPVAPFWRVAPDGILVHTLSWMEVAVDYSKVPTPDLSTFDEWTVDGDFFWKNFKGIESRDWQAECDVLWDSDEGMVVGLTSEQELHFQIRPTPAFSVPFLGNRLRIGIMQSIRHNRQVIDPFKRLLFGRPVKIHGSPLTPKWDKIARRAKAMIDRTEPYPTMEGLASLERWVKRIRHARTRRPSLLERVVTAAEFMRLDSRA